MNTLRSEIKILASQQKDLKNQRKTIHLTGNRTIEPWKAIFEHAHNRDKLRCMYMALGILRGKKPEEVESNPKTPVNKAVVDKFVENHKAEFEPKPEESGEAIHSNS